MVRVDNYLDRPLSWGHILHIKFSWQKMRGYLRVVDSLLVWFWREQRVRLRRLLVYTPLESLWHLGTLGPPCQLWKPPLPSSLKVNFDGVILDSGNWGRVAFAIRGPNSKFIIASGNSLFDISIPRVELWVAWRCNPLSLKGAWP